MIQGLDASCWDEKKVIATRRDGQRVILWPEDVVLLDQGGGWRLFLVDGACVVTGDIEGRAIYSHVHLWPNRGSASFMMNHKSLRGMVSEVVTCRYRAALVLSFVHPSCR